MAIGNEWLTVGAGVVEFTPTPRSGSGTAHIVEATVKSIGKRDVVLDNGSRYNVNRLRKSNGSWDPSTELVPTDDPRIAQARQANGRKNRLNKAHAAYEAFRRNPGVEESALLIRAVEAYAMKLGGADQEGRESDG